jgi:hypothetical protein
MNFMAFIKAPFSSLPFFTPTAGKIEPATKRNVARVKRPVPPVKESTGPSSPYRCTAIVFEDSACDAVKAIGRKRFLLSARDTPILPLPDCDQSRCHCRYMHHEDRREDDQDRRLAAALQTQLYEQDDKPSRRVKKRGRRKTDV